MGRLTNFSESMRAQIHSLAKTKAEEITADSIPDPLQSQSHIIEKAIISLEQQFADFFETFTVGTEELINGLILLHKNNPALDIGQIFSEIDLLPTGFDVIGNDPLDNRSLREICNLSDTTMQAYNEVVADLYDKQEYAKAAKVYAFLSFIEPGQPAYWRGYGNCEFFAGHYDKAISAYQTAIELDNTDPQDYFSSAHCYHELGLKEQAVAEVEKGIASLKQSNLLKQAEQLKQHFMESGVRRY